MGQNSDHPAGSHQFDGHREQNDQHRHHGAVDDQQHDRDDEEGDGSDLVGALATDFEVVGDQRRCPGDIGLHTRWRRGVGDDLADRVDRFVGRRLTLISVQVELHGRGLAVLALRSTGRERVTPEVLDVFHVFGVRRQPLDQPVVELVCVGTQRLVALEHDHRRAVGVEFTEHLPDVAHRHDRRCVRRVETHRAFGADDLELGRYSVGQHRDGDPDQHDGECEPPDQAGHP